MPLAVDRLSVRVLTVPTDGPESDGTLAWESTTMVLVQVQGDGAHGLGYTYGDAAAAGLIRSTLAPVVTGGPHAGVPAVTAALRRAVRNDGQRGLTAMAISAVDVALWDLAARQLDVPLCALLGAHRDAVPVYGSGGFCSDDGAAVAEQLGGWAAQGLTAVKMKVGRDPAADPGRVAAARAAIGDDVALFVDANGAYIPSQAREWAWRLRQEFGVSYLEEPVSSDDVAGLRRVRDGAPPGLAIAAGEYASTPQDLLGLLRAQAVDVQQADATRCGGITGLLAAARLADAHQVPFSAHCAPAIHAHACCAVERLAHLEWFHDHVRIERSLFDGFREPDADGLLHPDPQRPGLGLTLRPDVADRYAA